jgi:hypothetical protein
MGGPPVGQAIGSEGALLDTNRAPVEEWVQSGGGPPPNKGGWSSDPRLAARTGWQYLTNIWRECLDLFSRDRGFDASNFGMATNEHLKHTLGQQRRPCCRITLDTWC